MGEQKLISERYYWIMLNGDIDWQPAQYINRLPDDELSRGYFFITGNENEYYEDEVHRIGRIIEKPGMESGSWFIPHEIHKRTSIICMLTRKNEISDMEKIGWACAAIVLVGALIVKICSHA